MTNEQRIEIIERHVRELSEIYDSVQILGTWLDNDGTTKSQKRGSGNWYARKALCTEFAEEDSQSNLAEEIAKKLEPPDDTWKQ